MLVLTAVLAPGADAATSRDRARAQMVQRLGDQTYLTVDRDTGAIATLGRADGFLSAPREGSPRAAALAWLRDHEREFGLDDDDIAALRLRSEERGPDGATRLEWAQTTHGVESLDTAVRISVARDGRVINAGGSPVGDLEVASASPRLPKPAADAQLVAVTRRGGEARLAWRRIVQRRGRAYLLATDATTGEVLRRISLTDDVVNATVFENHPGAAAGGTRAATDIEAYLEPGFTEPAGPYAHVYADLVDDDLELPGEQISPTAGNDFAFPFTLMAAASGQFCPTAYGGATTCTWSGSLLDSSRATNRPARGAQLFYFLNRYHDWLAAPGIGFTAAEGAFEGSSNRVIGQIDDGNAASCSYLNNANMTTYPRGLSPVMQMYFFGTRSGCGAAPAVSASDDASVVYHEYTHGLSNRLIGNGSGLNSVQSFAMGEGWSDFYALDFLVANGYEPDTAADGEVAVGKYVTNDPDRGIRRAASDCSVGSAAANCQPISATAGPGGYTFGDLGRIGSPAAEEHDNGEIWTQTLWDLRKALGAPLARRLITDGMRLSPTVNPGFLDMRNSILAADLALGGGDVAAIWAVFATRGMGCSAFSSSANATTVTQSFDVPAPGRCGIPTAVTPPAQSPATTATAPPAPSISGLKSVIRLDRKGRYKLLFRATPAGARVSAKLSSAKRVRVGSKRSLLSFGSTTRTVPATGQFDAQIRVPARTLRAIRRLKRVKVTVTIDLAGARFKRSITFRRP